MLQILRHVLSARALSSSILCATAICAPPAISAVAQEAVAQEAVARRAPSHIALTQKQVDGWIAVQSAVQAAKPDAADAPQAKRLARLDAIVRANGFAGIEEYETVSEHVAKVIVGMDPDKGTYVGAGPMIRRQMAEIEADKTMPPADRAAALEEAKAALAAAEAAPPSAEDISIVSKSYGKLFRAVAGDRAPK